MTHTGPEVKEGAAGPVAVQADRGGTDTVPTLLAGLRAVNPALILIFGPRGDDLAALARGLAPQLPPGCVLAGCSSAGEIGPEGYASGKVVALGFPARHFRAKAIVLDRLSAIPVAEWMAGLGRMQRDFNADPARSVFGLMLADGLAGQEDVLVSTLDAALPAVPVIGGSAGDGLDFRDTAILAGGQVLRDAAVFLLVETDLAIQGDVPMNVEIGSGQRCRAHGWAAAAV
ncbi:hypothetical protein KY389_14595, partial [Paracoccus bogoriensis]|uniref:FIST N-terminal domain-containing protein n=1 Tax=Paracoccus bogoriensis TaxID=242065 RepID=UPI002484C89E